MVSRVFIKRTTTDNSPPTGLLPGELACEMGNPTRLWIGVPAALGAPGNIKQLTPSGSAPVDAYTKAESDANFVNIPGDTMTGGLTIGAAGNLAPLNVYGPTVTNGLTNNGAMTVTGFVTCQGQARIGPGITLNSAQGSLTVDNNMGVAAQFMDSQQIAGALAVRIQNDRTDGGCIGFDFGGTSIGGISNNGSVITYNTGSDYRLKTVYGSANSQVGAMFDAVPVYDAEWLASTELLARSEGEHTYRYPMFLAHELQAQCPWAVTGEKDAVDSDGGIISQQVDNSQLIPVLWAEIQNLRQRIAALEATP